MKEFTFYYWQSDDEGGYLICRTEEFSPKRNFQPDTGWRAIPSQKVGEFNTVEELAEIIFDEMGSDLTMEECLEEAKMYFQWYQEDLEDC